MFGCLMSIGILDVPVLLYYYGLLWLTLIWDYLQLTTALFFYLWFVICLPRLVLGFTFYSLVHGLCWNGDSNKNQKAGMRGVYI